MAEAIDTAASQPSGATPGITDDPYRVYNFKLEVQGVVAGHFTECGGLQIDIEPIRYREGGARQVVRAIPGQVTYGDVTLRYGLTTSTELWGWLMTAVEGRVERKNTSVVMLDADGETEALRWNLINAWPSRWRGAPLDALGREVAIESLTLVVEAVQRG